MLPNFRRHAILIFAGFLAVGISSVGCGSGTSAGGVLKVDAEYNPVTTTNANFPLHETEIAVGQTFTVLAPGKLDQIQIALTQGALTSQGIVRVDVRPVLGTGEPEPDDVGAIMTPVDIDTNTLPAAFVDEFTVIDISEQPGRDVVAGEEYAVVVTYLSRSAGVAGQPIAVLLGRGGDEFAGGTGSTNSDNTGFVNIATDYFFRTFVLQ